MSVFTMTMAACLVLSQAAPPASTTGPAADSAASTLPALSAAVSMPGVFFVGPEAKAQFLTAVEESLTKAAGQPVRASFDSSASAMKSAHFWVIDGYMAAVDKNAHIVSRAHRQNRTSGPVAVFASRKWPNSFAALTKGSVGVGGASDDYRRFARYWLLADEPGSSSMVKRIKAQRDVRGALANVAAGSLDVTIAYHAAYGELDTKLKRLVLLTDLATAPYPVLAINKARSSSSELKALQTKVQGAALPAVAGLIDGWKAAGSGELDSVGRSIRGSSRLRRDIVLRPSETLMVDLVGLLPKPPTSRVLGPDTVMPAPRYEPLPELPEADFEESKGEAPKPVSATTRAPEPRNG